MKSDVLTGTLSSALTRYRGRDTSLSCDVF